MLESGHLAVLSYLPLLRNDTLGATINQSVFCLPSEANKPQLTDGVTWSSILIKT